MKVFGVKTFTCMDTSVPWLFPRYSELEHWVNGTGLRAQRVNLQAIMVFCVYEITWTIVQNMYTKYSALSTFGNAVTTAGIVQYLPYAEEI